MIQAMQILQLPLLDLSERIEQELTENPFLEVVESDGDGGDSDDYDADSNGRSRAEESPRERSEAETASGTESAESMLELFDRIDRDFGDGTRGRMLSGEDGDRKYEAMLNAPDGAATFAEAVLEQLSTTELTDRERTVLEYVVWSLDERGYLTETPATLAAELTREVQRTLLGTLSGAVAVEGEDAPINGEATNGTTVQDDAEASDEESIDPEDLVVTEDEVRDALERLREAVHPGLGALDLKECLLLQLPGLGLWNPFMRQLVEKHLDDVRSNRLPQIAKSTGRDIEDVKAAIELLKGLDPAPGSGFGDTTAEVIHPEVIVELDDGELTVRLDRERTPELRIPSHYQSKSFRKMLREGDKEERDWARKRLESASWFIDALLQRQTTLERISNALFRRQIGFLERGKEALKPLRMQEIADEVGVHISTVSRAVAGKYAQTPRGIFALKFFFVGGTTKSSGEETSQISIKERIKKIVGAEDPKKPLSDEAISKALEEEDGIKIARRTVTKYRKALEIPSSTQRKQY